MLALNPTIRLRSYHGYNGSKGTLAIFSIRLVMLTMCNRPHDARLLYLYEAHVAAVKSAVGQARVLHGGLCGMCGIVLHMMLNLSDILYLQLGCSYLSVSTRLRNRANWQRLWTMRCRSPTVSWRWWIRTTRSGPEYRTSCSLLPPCGR